MMLVLLYLVAIVSANLLVTTFGPGVSIVTAFGLIGLTITTRDRLHDLWGDALKRNMALLIVTGSLLSWVVNAGAARIAIASALAFGISETLDALVYHRLRRNGWWQRSNGSNVVSAMADSIAFPTLAFGMFLPWVVVGQFVAKVVGGAIWSVLLRPRRMAITTMLCLFAALPLRAQIASLDAGVIRTPFFTEPVVELFVAGPPVSVIRPFGILSHRFGDARISGQVQVGLSKQIGPIAVGATSGAIFLPYRDWQPDWTAGVQAQWFTPLRDWSVLAIYSRRPRYDGDYTFIAKVSHTVLFWQ